MNHHAATSTGAERYVVLDAARFVALAGMVLVNFKIVMGAEGAGPGWLAWLLGGVTGRAAALFVILAGAGLSLLARRARAGGDPAQLARARGIVLRRALLLFVAGLAYSPLWPADILHFYGLYLTLGAMVLGATDRLLWALAVAVNAVFVALLLTLDYEAGWDWTTLDYAGFWTPEGLVRHMFFNGFHPFFPWVAFLLIGIWLGRRDLRDRRWLRRLGIAALAVLVTVELLSRWLIRAAGGGEDAAALFGTGPMPPVPFYVASASASALLVIVLATPLCRRWADAAWLRALASTGRMTLTHYVAHVVIGMGTLDALGLLRRQRLSTVSIAATLFCAAAVGFSWWWERRFARGPLEQLMRRVCG